MKLISRCKGNPLPNDTPASHRSLLYPFPVAKHTNKFVNLTILQMASEIHENTSVHETLQENPEQLLSISMNRRAI